MAGLDEPVPGWVVRHASLGDEEFVGYLFRGAPERRPRLWFIESQVCTLLRHDWAITGEDGQTGTWTAVDRPLGCDEKGLGGCILRYDHHDGQPWSAVWELTDLAIPHVTVLGRDDDVWRLGLWPD